MSRKIDQKSKTKFQPMAFVKQIEGSTENGEPPAKKAKPSEENLGKSSNLEETPKLPKSNAMAPPQQVQNDPFKAPPAFSLPGPPAPKKRPPKVRSLNQFQNFYQCRVLQITFIRLKMNRKKR